MTKSPSSLGPANSAQSRHYLHALVGILPPAIARLSIVRDEFSISEIPLPRILTLIMVTNLPNLARLDFPDCERADVEEATEAADVLAECKRRSIRVVYWEDFL